MLRLLSVVVALTSAALFGQRVLDTDALRGRITDPDGKPVAGVLVDARRCEAVGFTCLDLDYGAQTRVVSRLPTGRAGTFALHVPRSLPCRLRVDLPPYAVELRQGLYGGEEVEIRLRPAAKIRGQVVRLGDGAPLPNSFVRGYDDNYVELFRGRTDSKGKFECDRLMPGNLSIAVAPRGGAVPRRTTVELVGGETTDCRIEVEAGAKMHGRVTDAATGKPIAGAEVGVGWTFRKSVRTGADGRYVLHGLGGPYSNPIHVRAAGYGKTQIARPDRKLGDVERDVELRKGFKATGRIVDADGKPVENCYVAAIGMTHDGREQRTDWLAARTDGEGRFRVVGLRRALRHVLFVRRDGRATLVVPFPDESSPPIDVGVVELRPRRIVSGRILDDGGAPRVGMHLVLRGRNAFPGEKAGAARGILEGYIGAREARTDSLGRFHFGDLAPGSYRLSLGRGSGREEIATLEVAADRDPDRIELVR